jgi:hypothetical protein
MAAGEQLLETDIPQDQLGSFINLADKSRKTPFKRLTLGAPDFGYKFSTYPDYAQIHARVDKLLQEASGTPAPKSAAPSKTRDDAGASATATGGGTSTATGGAATGATSAAATAGGAGTGEATDGSTKAAETIEPGMDPDAVPSTQPDGSPITEEYLVNLEINGQRALISQIAANNNECSVP